MRSHRARVRLQSGRRPNLLASTPGSVAQDRVATLADRLSMLVDRTGYRAMLRESEAEETVDWLENLQGLLTLAGGFHNANELLDHAALASAAPGEMIDSRVQLMTVHKGKTLEFPHVFLAGWYTGSFPSAYGDHDEERRLAYVALTRGMQRIALTQRRLPRKLRLSLILHRRHPGQQPRDWLALGAEGATTSRSSRHPADGCAG